MEDTRQNVDRAVRQSGCNNVAKLSCALKLECYKTWTCMAISLMYKDKFDLIASQTTYSTTEPYPYTHPHYPPIRAFKSPLKYTQSVQWYN